MLNFKASVAKNNKRFNIIVKSDSEKNARSTLHKEWYSILSIELTWDIDSNWNKYYFTIITDDWEKNWTIIWEDIFLLYLKLRKDLWYNVKYLYDNVSEDDNTKKNIIFWLEEKYEIYLEELNKKNKKTSSSEDFSKAKEEKEFFAKKEINKIKDLNSFILIKLKNILEWKVLKNLDSSKKIELKNIYNSIVQVQWITNITKLKEIWELALKKIWELELAELEKNKEIETKELLKETNKILKKLGSSVSFIEKDKDIKVIVAKTIDKINNSFKNFFEWNKKEELDKLSHSFIKSVLLLKKYQSKYDENKKLKTKNFFNFLLNTKKTEELRNTILVREKVLKQNIDLLKIRINWNKFSYTKMEKWYNFVVLKILIFLNIFKEPLNILIIIFSWLFILSWLLQYYWLFSIWFNYIWLKIFLYLIFMLIFIKLSKWLISMLINIAFFIFIFIFSIINF